MSFKDTADLIVKADTLLAPGPGDDRSGDADQ